MSVSADVSPFSIPCTRPLTDAMEHPATTAEFAAMGTEVIMQEMLLLEPVFRAAVNLANHAAFLAVGILRGHEPDTVIDPTITPMAASSSNHSELQD